MLVSSGYMDTRELFKQLGRSLKETRKRGGPRQDPCGTPQAIQSVAEIRPFTLQH